MATEASRWLDMAEMDYGAAKHLYDTYHPMPIEIICYHCQQAAEKAVKALILSEGFSGDVPRKHDISFLLGQLKGSIEIDERYYDYADTLTPYGVAVRYPSELHLEVRHAKTALQYARELLDWARQNITEQTL